MTFSPAEVVISVYAYSINVVGIVANLLLLFLVLKKSTKHMEVYTILLLNFGLVDLVGCAAGIFIQQRLIPLGGSIGFISLGPCRFISATACYVGYSIGLHCYSHSLWSILISFVFRYRILVSRMPSFGRLLTVVLLFYSISLFQLIVCILAESPSDQVVQLLHQIHPEYDLSGKTVSGNLNIFGWKELFTNLHMVLPIVPVYIVIIIIGISIVRHLQTDQMSVQTKAMHSQLLKALVTQALLPAFYFLTILVFLLEQSGVLNSEILEYACVMIIGMLPVTSPLCTLYFVTPYKRWITRNVLQQRRGAAISDSAFSNPSGTNVTKT